MQPNKWWSSLKTISTKEKFKLKMVENMTQIIKELLHFQQRPPSASLPFVHAKNWKVQASEMKYIVKKYKNA